MREGISDQRAVGADEGRGDVERHRDRQRAVKGFTGRKRHAHAARRQAFGKRDHFRRHFVHAKRDKGSINVRDEQLHSNIIS